MSGLIPGSNRKRHRQNQQQQHNLKTRNSYFEESWHLSSRTQSKTFIAKKRREHKRREENKRELEKRKELHLQNTSYRSSLRARTES
jgi:hypothetical protein